MLTQPHSRDIVFACQTADDATSLAEALNRHMSMRGEVIKADGRTITLTCVPDDLADELLAVGRAYFFAKGG